MFTFELAKSFNDMFAVRLIRNTCRDFMTRDTHKISIIGQLRWCLEYRKNSEWWCYIARVNNLSVGYGLVRFIDGKFWLSGGLLPELRGKGLGEKIFRNLINKFIKVPELYLEVLDTNEGAYKLYTKLGFIKTGKKGNIITMRRKSDGRKI